jgi:hypothetical protein
VILGIELAQAKPAELKLALATLHELAALALHDHHVARWALLRKQHLVKVTVSIVVIYLLH